MMCACFAGLETYVNVALAYTMLTVTLQVLVKLRREKFLHVSSDDDLSDDSFDEDNDAYEVADNFQQRSLTMTVYQRVESRSTAVLSILLPTMLAGSLSVPYFLFSQIIPAKQDVDLCTLRDSDDLTLNLVAQIFILLLRVVVPLMALLIAIVATLFKYTRTRRLLSSKTSLHVRAALVLAISFVASSGTHLLQNSQLLNYRTMQPYIVLPFKLTKELVLISTLLNYGASLVRPVFVILVTTRWMRVCSKIVRK